METSWHKKAWIMSARKKSRKSCHCSKTRGQSTTGAILLNWGYKVTKREANFITSSSTDKSAVLNGSIEKWFYARNFRRLMCPLFYNVPKLVSYCAPLATSSRLRMAAKRCQLRRLELWTSWKCVDTKLTRINASISDQQWDTFIA